MLWENVSSYGWTSHWSQKYICLPGVKEAMTKITWQIAWKSFYTIICKLPYPNFEETIRECSFFIPGVGTEKNELGKPFFEGLECVYSKWGHLEHTNQLHCRTKIEKSTNGEFIYMIGWFVVTWLQIGAMFAAGQQMKMCCPYRPATHVNKQNCGTIWIIRNYDFPRVCVQIKNVKEKKNTQQETGYMLPKPFK